MKKNVGKFDRVVRVVLGLGFVALSIWVSLWFLIGVVIMFGTAALGVCPLYIPFGIDTLNCKKKQE